MYISLGFQYNAFEFYGTIKFLCLKCSDSKVLGHIVISLHYRASHSLCHSLLLLLSISI